MKPRRIDKQEAQSGRVGFSQPIVIHGGPGKSTHFEILLEYVHHDTRADELAAKVSYWKRTADGLRTGYPAEFTLSQPEVQQLIDVLQQGLMLAGQAGAGSYLLLPLDDDNAAAGSADPRQLVRALSTLLGNQELLVGLTSHDEVAQTLATAAQTSNLKLAVARLEDLLNNGEVAESLYQDWCERYDWAFGNAYAMRDDVRTIALGDQVDILMAATSHGLRDIFELKRPDHEVLNFDKDHKSWYWSRAVSQAIGQCHRYLDALHDAAGAGLRDHPEIIAYHPRAVIIIGRSSGWEQDKYRALHGLNARLHGIEIRTYDQLLEQARESLRRLTVPSPGVPAS